MTSSTSNAPEGVPSEHPMAIGILGGLVTATPLNLFVRPSLCLRFAKSRKWRPPAAAEPAPPARGQPASEAHALS
jgi:hypothetical protein